MARQSKKNEETQVVSTEEMNEIMTDVAEIEAAASKTEVKDEDENVGDENIVIPEEGNDFSGSTGDVVTVKEDENKPEETEEPKDEEKKDIDGREKKKEPVKVQPKAKTPSSFNPKKERPAINLGSNKNNNSYWNGVVYGY